MKTQIQQLLQQTLDILITQQILPKEGVYRIQVDRTKDKAHGDLSTNLAMMACKAAKKPPRELAQLIIENMPVSDLVVKAEIAGPGFINIFLNSNILAQQIEAALLDERLGIAKVEQPQTIVVDMSSPNLAKEMHVGHLRSSVIGDAVTRNLEFLGHKMIRQNHVGDWGTQFGMLLAYMEELKAQGKSGSSNLADLEVFYRAAKGRFDESEEFATRARNLVVELQSGNQQCLQLWHDFKDISIAHCQEIYDRLGVALTTADVRGESAYNDDLNQVVADLEACGILEQSQDAKCVFLDEFKSKTGEPLPVIIQKKDGGFLYATTDLAAMRYRQNVLKADRVLYFVDARQALHFQQVFMVAKKAKFVSQQISLEHMPFGTVMGEDGKPFKTRSGNVAKLADLLTEAQQRALALVQQKSPDKAPEEMQKIADVVGIASVKYADLSKNRTSNYVFSFEQMLKFEGNTATYMLYAYARIVSIFNKAGLDMAKLEGSVVLEHEKELELAGKLMQFNEALNAVSRLGSPHLLCSYLFELAGIFSSFYEACPLIKAETETQKHSRFKLAALTAKTLKQGLDLLGIKTLERM
ncbi:arginine--tRNA ligase ['Osedax' symbiont bacterium Rs2_46_30_T18]|nr:arginine--tRNA ligase ['Osedax' symbiont bacterium Rs2_46_30_T18]